MAEAEARKSGADVLVSKLGLEHVLRAIASRDTRGFVKLVVDAKTRLFLGAHVLVPEAGEMIEECVMATRHRIRSTTSRARCTRTGNTPKTSSWPCRPPAKT